LPQKRIVRIVNATEAKTRFGEMIKRAYSNDEHLVVKKSGIPVVVIVPIQDYEQLVRQDELPSEAAAEIAQSTQAAASRVRLRSFLAETSLQMPDVAEVEVEQDIQEAVEAIHKQA
jgi:prevent-host-death family protein